MHSEIEVDEDLYTLRINCKGERTVGKANKGINVEKIIIMGLKKKTNHSPELQKLNREAEVYNNNKKCD